MQRNILALKTDGEVMEILTEAEGVLVKAAKALQVHHSTLSRRIQKTEELKAHVEGLRAMKYDIGVDEAEGIIEAARKGESTTKAQLTAAIFTLKTHGKKRGWVERQEVTGKDGAPMGLLVAPVPAQNAEEWKAQNKAKRVEQAED